MDNIRPSSLGRDASNEQREKINAARAFRDTSNTPDCKKLWPYDGYRFSCRRLPHKTPQP